MNWTLVRLAPYKATEAVLPFVALILLLISDAPAGPLHAPFTFVTALANPNAAVGDSFGRNLSDYDGRILVGDPLGSATYLYDKSGALLAHYEHDYIFPLGSSVAGANDRVYVAGNGSLFVFDANTTQQIDEIAGPRSQPNLSRFGQSMAIKDGYLFVSAPEPAFGNLFVGFGYVAQYELAATSLTQVISNPTPGSSTQPIDDEQFGYSMATTGNHLIVGDLKDLISGTRTGGVYLLDPASGDVLRTLTSPDSSNGIAKQFGASVAGLGDRVLVGDNQATGGGAAYLFEAGSGLLSRTFYDPNPNSGNANFGRVVELLGDYVAIGSSKAIGDTGFDGVVYIYDAMSGNLVQELKHPFGVNDELFGANLCRIGDNILAIATNPSGVNNPGDPGSVFIYAIPEPHSWAILLCGLFLAIPLSLRLRLETR